MNKLTEKGIIIKGYKATNVDMTCNGFKFELGKWYEHEGEIKICESGFHFCEYPSGPLSYYIQGRIFKCEAEFVYISKGPGADLKHVAKRIRLVEEISILGDRNTGDGNTGDRNTGDSNTGNSNTGDRNTGDRNKGDRNTGYGNTGNRNTGDRNTGDRNTGDRNTGYSNTGNGNTGNWNTGNSNTGNWNTGNGNASNNHYGFFNIEEPVFYIFDEIANKSKVNIGLSYELCEKLSKDEKFDCSKFLSLPNATEEKIIKLHEAHIKKRREYKND